MTAPVNANPTAPVTTPEANTTLRDVSVAEGMDSLRKVAQVRAIAGAACGYFESHASEQN